MTLEEFTRKQVQASIDILRNVGVPLNEIKTRQTDLHYEIAREQEGKICVLLSHSWSDMPKSWRVEYNNACLARIGSDLKPRLKRVATAIEHIYLGDVT